MLLNVENLEKEFEGLTALREVSFDVEPGGITGIIGPNGAGKTTLFNVISGHLPPTHGRIFLESRDITGFPAHRIASLGLSRTFQNVRPFRDMTVLENVLTGLHAGPTDGLVSASLRLPGLVRREQRKIREVYHILEMLNLEKDWDKGAQSLPFGPLRLLEIARALAAKPRILLLDEPAAGLNRTETSSLAKILKRINQKGITILLVEHDMRLVMGIVQYVIVLDAGRIIARGSPDEIRHNPDVIRAYLGDREI